MREQSRNIYNIEGIFTIIEKASKKNMSYYVEKCKRKKIETLIKK